MGPACGPSRASRRLDAPAPRGPERGPERGGVSMTTGLTPDSPNTRAVLGPTKDLRAGSAPVPAPGHGTSNHANSRGRGDHRGRSGGGRTMRDSRAQERLKSRRAILECSRFPSPALVVGLQQASKPTRLWVIRSRHADGKLTVTVTVVARCTNTVRLSGLFIPARSPRRGGRYAGGNVD